MAQEVLENKKNIPIYTGWNQELYDALTPAGKKGYFIAAIVHDGVKRKDGSWYLVHVNRSLQFFHSHKNLFGTKFDASNIERNIALHDCAEDLDIGALLIREAYGDDRLIQVLWMSEMNQNIRTFLPGFIEILPEKTRVKYQIFLDLIRIIENSIQPGNRRYDFIQLVRIFPNGVWIRSWNEHFSSMFEQEFDPEEKKNIFAEFVFQGMLYHMPEDCFLAKSAERIDNLRDIKGLKNDNGVQSYKKTLYTTNFSYLPRLSLLYPQLAYIMDTTAGVGIRELSQWRQDANRILTT